MNVAIKWLNHNEMANFPIIINFFLLNDRNRPSINPNESVNIIVIL